MAESEPNNPLRSSGLMFLQGFLGLGGIGGGIALLVDPTGQVLELPPDSLDGLAIDSFLLPGLFLILVMGMLPPLAAVSKGLGIDDQFI